ncbi:MAG: hypothetical protein C5B47_05825 [Verrucomicrobia bacterium]|nr:MAG: hypothetical protein C5B47_05825 [Verrucomicrobiota bacterium]
MPQRIAFGFTLLETVIALGILATAIMGLLITLKSTVDTVKTLQQESEIRHELENRLARLQIETRRELHQESAPNPSGISYIEEISPQDVIKSDHTTLNGYRRLKVTAKWEDQRGSQQREASFLVFAP